MSSQTDTGVSRNSDTDLEKTEEFVTFKIAEQLFGIPVLQIQDVLSSYKITRIPLAPPEITGSLNLRGRIVTAIDLRLRLGLRAQARCEVCGMNVTDFELIAQLLKERSGLALNKEKAYLLESRLNPVARQWNFSGFDELAQAIRKKMPRRFWST